MRFQSIALEKVSRRAWKMVYRRKRGGGERPATMTEVCLWKRILHLERTIKRINGPFTCSHDSRWIGGACAACHAEALEKIEKLEGKTKS